MAAPQAYASGKIYKEVNINDPDEFYVGSSKNELRKRHNDHKACSKDPLNTAALYVRMREIGCDNFRIVLLEEWPCDTKDQLRAREDHWIVQLKPKLNVKRAFLTEAEKLENHLQNNKEYREDNPVFWSERAKSYHAANKEAIHARKSEKKKCPDCSAMISSACMARHKRLKHFD